MNQLYQDLENVSSFLDRDTSPFMQMVTMPKPILSETSKCHQINISQASVSIQQNNQYISQSSQVGLDLVESKEESIDDDSPVNYGRNSVIIKYDSNVSIERIIEE